jgi:hypothetical protein
MNEFTLASRRPRENAASADLPDDPANTAADASILKPGPRLLPTLSREELLREALYDSSSPAATGPDALDDDHLRKEVRWRRATTLREPAYTALARLLSKVQPCTFESLSQGDISPEQLIDSANAFASGQNGVKVLKIPDRVDDHERRLNNLEASTD